VVLVCLLAAVVFHRIPSPCNVDVEEEEPSEESFAKFIANLRSWRAWLPSVSLDITIYACASGLATFVVATTQLLYLKQPQALFPPYAVVSPGIFMILFCVGEFFGGSVGSAIAPSVPFPRGVSLAGPVLAVAFVASRVPALAVLCCGVSEVGFSVACVLSSVAITTRVGCEYTLTAMSALLLMEGIVSVVTQVAVGPWSTIIGPIGAA
jgi:hypothetical protein